MISHSQGHAQRSWHGSDSKRLNVFTQSFDLRIGYLALMRNDAASYESKHGSKSARTHRRLGRVEPIASGAGSRRSIPLNPVAPSGTEARS